MLHVECSVLSVRQESSGIYFIGCNKSTVDKFAHTLKSRGAENLGPNGIRSPDRPTHNESLYRFAVPGTSRLEILTVFNNVLTRYEDDLRVGGSYFQRLP